MLIFFAVALNLGVTASTCANHHFGNKHFSHVQTWHALGTHGVRYVLLPFRVKNVKYKRAVVGGCMGNIAKSGEAG